MTDLELCRAYRGPKQLGVVFVFMEVHSSWALCLFLWRSTAAGRCVCFYGGPQQLGVVFVFMEVHSSWALCLFLWRSTAAGRCICFYGGPQQLGVVFVFMEVHSSWALCLLLCMYQYKVHTVYFYVRINKYRVYTVL